jgi:glycine dehydrogenase
MTDRMSELYTGDEFISRHIGPTVEDQRKMLDAIGVDSLDTLINQTVPEAIKSDSLLGLQGPVSEPDVLSKIRKYADRIKVTRSLIGMGYYPSYTPSVIQRNILENPAWYTAYTPYQPEISQGRLEALLNFQTMVCDLTGLEIANASLLDEATAAAEAMVFCRKSAKAKGDVFFVSSNCHPQIIDVVQTRAEPIGIRVVIGDETEGLVDQAFAVLLQYPNTNGDILDYVAITEMAHSKGAMIVVAADLLALTLIKPPGEWGADVVVGSSIFCDSRQI